MSDSHPPAGTAAPPRATIPPDESATVQQLVQREVAGLIAVHRAEIDLAYRIQRHKELADRYRALRSEAAEVKRQMQALNLPPQYLRTLKVE